jgi:hypothetical protein
VAEQQSQRKAEAELVGRERRVHRLDIRPLTPAAQAKYAADWAAVQERFVDQPQQAVTEAQRLVISVMNERGYPTENHDQITADLSVEHAAVLDHYRAAQEISANAAAGTTSTEDLRQAMIHYRALFGELLGQADETGPGATGTPSAAPAATISPARPTSTGGSPPAETDTPARFEAAAEPAAPDPEPAADYPSRVPANESGNGPAGGPEVTP